MEAPSARFITATERVYTLRRADTPVEIVTLRVDALGIFPQPQLPEPPRGGDPDAAIVGISRSH